MQVRLAGRIGQEAINQLQRALPPPLTEKS